LIVGFIFGLQTVCAQSTIQPSEHSSSNTISSGQTGVNNLNGDLLYSDDFSSSKSGWYTSSKGSFIAAYKNGKYHLTVVPTDYWWPASGPLKTNVTDFVMEVEATKEVGPDDNVFGIAAREIDNGNYYAFLISNDGYYEIAKKENSSWVTPSNWIKSDAIKVGNATNVLKLMAKGDSFTFFVNGIKLTDYQDSSFKSGYIGMFAGTQSEGNVTIGFDNLKVWSLKQ
jgi:hypothetical protein